jgi:hypothetical protein
MNTRRVLTLSTISLRAPARLPGTMCLELTNSRQADRAGQICADPARERINIAGLPGERTLIGTTGAAALPAIRRLSARAA